MDNTLIYTIITGVLSLAGIYLTKVGAKSDLNGAIKMLKDLVSTQENEINILRHKNEKDEKEDFFKKSFKNIVASTASLTINNDSLVKDNNTIVSVLTFYSKQIAEYGLKFHFSDFRNNPVFSKNAFYTYLRSDLDSIMLIFIHLLADGIKEERAYMHGNQVVSIGFIEYMATIDKANKEPDLFAYNEILITDLVANGLDETKLLTKFVTYIENFINSFKKKYKEFSGLMLYDDYLKEKCNVV